MKFLRLTTCVALFVSAAFGLAHAAGPAIDWDPAYTYEAGATPFFSAAGGEFNMVGIISQFGPPFEDLNAGDPSKEFTFWVHGLISLGTVVGGPPATQFYTTNYTGGSIEIYQDNTPDASFVAYPPNATVPAKFIDGTLILGGSFTSFVVQTNNFTAYDVGNIEGNINWTSGTLLDRTHGALGVPCPGLFTGGATWYPPIQIPGYIFRHVGKVDLQCPVPAHSSTWGKIKSLYR